MKLYNAMNTLIVNYDIPLKDVIAEGKYDWVNRNITQENFGKPYQTGTVTLEWGLFNFPGKEFSSEGAIRRIEDKGYRPATHFELATFGAQYPEVQLEKMTIGLGSYWVGVDGGRRVACLDGDSRHRCLRLDRWSGDWCGLYWFLGVQKVGEIFSDYDAMSYVKRSFKDGYPGGEDCIFGEAEKLYFCFTLDELRTAFSTAIKQDRKER